MKAIFLGLAVMLSGCTTIYFENGETAGTAPTTEKWHHNVVLNLVEVSSPVDLEKECAGKEWESAKTELSFINGLAGGLAGAIVPFIWYPKTVSVACEK